MNKNYNKNKQINKINNLRIILPKNMIIFYHLCPKKILDA